MRTSLCGRYGIGRPSRRHGGVGGLAGDGADARGEPVGPSRIGRMSRPRAALIDSGLTGTLTASVSLA